MGRAQAHKPQPVGHKQQTLTQDTTYLFDQAVSLAGLTAPEIMTAGLLCLCHVSRFFFVNENRIRGSDHMLSRTRIRREEEVDVSDVHNGRTATSGSVVSAHLLGL